MVLKANNFFCIKPNIIIDEAKPLAVWTKESEQDMLTYFFPKKQSYEMVKSKFLVRKVNERFLPNFVLKSGVYEYVELQL